MKIPAHHQTIMPYLILKDARAFLRFAQNVFGAEILYENLTDDLKLRHAEIKIGDNTIMLSEANEIWNVNNSALFIYVDDADKVFKKSIDEGAESILEIENKDYGRSGGIKDPFGNIWWITSL